MLFIYVQILDLLDGTGGVTYRDVLKDFDQYMRLQGSQEEKEPHIIASFKTLCNHTQHVQYETLKAGLLPPTCV